MSTSNPPFDEQTQAGLEEERLEAESSSISYNNYTGHSQKPTPEQVYYDGNFYYWLWDNGFNDTPTGENRTGPQAVTTPPGTLVGEELLDIKQIDTAYNLLDGWNPGETFEERIALYEDVAPFFFDPVVDEEGNVDYPGMELLFDVVVNGTTLQPNDPRLMAIKAPYTNEKIEYLNALGKSGYTISGKPNQKLLALRTTRASQLDTAITGLGLNPNDYKNKNPETYASFLNTAVQGDISAGLLKNFIGYVEGIDGYEISNEDVLYPLFSSVADRLSVDSSGLDLSDYIFNNKAQARGTEILGAGVYNDLGDSEKKNIATLFATEYPDPSVTVSGSTCEL